jgi:5-formyltetrahydrofolate cyclo-ligase
MMISKKILREKYKQYRSVLTVAQVDEKSILIANQLLKMAIWDKTYYHVFLTIERLKEVDTDLIIQILMGRDKEIVVSKSDFETYTLAHFLLTDNTKIVVNNWGIPEPANGLMVPVSSLDVVFVPVLAFDLKGNRVGYGKGFYDRFLASCRKDVLKIGVSFFESETALIETTSQDISLDFCVTPQGIHVF